MVGSLTPGQALIGVVHRELTRVMGEESKGLNLAAVPPVVVLMAGGYGVRIEETVALQLQTFRLALAHWLKSQGIAR